MPENLQVASGIPAPSRPRGTARPSHGCTVRRPRTRRIVLSRGLEWAGGRGRAEPAGATAGLGSVGRKIGGPLRLAKLIIDDMFRHAVFAWLAVAGLVAAAPVRAADSPAGCPLAGKRS